VLYTGSFWPITDVNGGTINNALRIHLLC